MTIGSVLEVFHGVDAESGERIGSGVVIHDRIVQLDNDAAKLLRGSPHRAEQIHVPGITSQRSVRRIRPGLTDFDTASRIVAERADGLELLSVDGDLVYLELTCDKCGCGPCEHDGSGNGDDECGPPTSEPWYCKIACILDCRC